VARFRSSSRRRCPPTEDDAGGQTQQPSQPPDTQANPQTDSTEPVGQKKQPARILWVIPNYRAVSSDVKVPPLTPHQKFKLMVDDSFDYSAFLYTGFVAGLRMTAASYPQFGEGPAAYGRYYTTGAPLSIMFREIASPSGCCR
jgi:hypothetical protein